MCCAGVDKYTSEHVSLCMWLRVLVSVCVCVQVCVCGFACSIVYVCVSVNKCSCRVGQVCMVWRRQLLDF